MDAQGLVAGGLLGAVFPLLLLFIFLWAQESQAVPRVVRADVYVHQPVTPQRGGGVIIQSHGRVASTNRITTKDGFTLLGDFQLGSRLGTPVLVTVTEGAH